MTSPMISDAAELIRMEYMEMPGLALTFWQVQRLCNLPRELCDGALDTLLDAGFLKRTADGHYIRRGSHPPLVMAIRRVVREAS